MKIKKRKCNRTGATAVEFAMVAPVFFGFVFMTFEISRLMLLQGNINSATLVGLRKASLVDSTPSEVESLIKNELAQFGISKATIQFSPANFDRDVEELDINIEVPVNGSNGFCGCNLVAPKAVITKSIRVDREPR